MCLIRRIVVCLLISGSCLTAAQNLPEGRLMRFPDVQGDKIAFVYGGDIWLASAHDGVARRITTHPGRELFPKFSPDGKWIAFTAQYDGNFNVYVMPAEGGQPKQLTFLQGGAPLSERMGIHNQVVTWTPDSKRIVFLSRRDAYNGWSKRPYTVAVEGGLPEPLPMDQGGLLSFNGDGSKLAYNPIFRNFRTWKRYTGGMAQDIEIYDVKANTIEKVPHTEWTDTFPMWRGNTIYFSSDRGPERRLNLYAYDLSSRKIEQLTKFTDYDVMWPSLGPDAIIFENGGYLYQFDLNSKQPKKLTIYLPGENGITMKHWAGVSKFITDFDISPDGKRAAFAARGDVYTVPAKEGSIRNLTRTPGVREKLVSWSPDGRWIAYISDRTGEDELYIMPQDGMGKEQQITSGYQGFKYGPSWSQDSRKIAWSDKDLRLWYADITTRQAVQVDQAKYFEIQNYSWSPDSKWLAYDKQAQNGNAVVNLYSLADKKITEVTNDFSNSYAPIFDPDGSYLYFLSDRDFNEVLGNIDFEFANPKTTRVYIATLHADQPSPFPPLSDETTVKSENPPSGLLGVSTAGAQDAKTDGKPGSEKDKAKDDSKDKESKDKEKEKKAPFRIDLEGIGQRIVALPTGPGVIRSFAAAKGYIYYSTTAVQGLSGPIPGEDSAIQVYDLKDRKQKTLVEGPDRFVVSADGSKVLFEGEGGGNGKSYNIIDAKPGESPKKASEGALKLEGMRAEIDPPQEWKQIFNEVWRQERDYFFQKSMNGVDWEKVRQRYAPLAERAASRYDLTLVMGEMIAELSNSHTYVGGGDQPDLHPVTVGLLGVDFEADKSGFYRIKKIYPGENWDSKLRSPLTEPGVNVKEGEFIVAVNGRPLRVPQNPYELFVNTANENVSLAVNSKASEEGARTVQVKPIPDEFGLHELNWIETNRKKVEAATHGRVGYVYLPDMGAAGLNQFVKQYFPQLRKEGIIFDVRYNGGGFVDQLIFERLRRVLAGMGSARNWEPNTVPPNVFYGAMACVTNHYAASDGDLFSYHFKHYKLGPLIGTRTWGGVRGIRGQIPLIDGGFITRPEFSRYNLDGQWIIENRGVAPDIEVENRPDLVVKGQDPQLEKAIEVVMQEIQAHPKVLPARPPDLPAYPLGPGM